MTSERGASRLGRAGRFAFLAAAAIGLLVCVAVVSFFVAFKAERRSTEVEVPDLAGLSLDEARRVARAAGVVVEVVAERHDPTLSSGRVLGQVPPSGAAVREGRKVKIVLSLGGEVLTVPDLVGRPARAVTIELSREGFGLGEEARCWSRGMASGLVLAQVPPAGSPSLPGSRIHRLVSQGPPPARWVMPDLVGMPLPSVERWATTSGFRLAPVRRVSDPDESPGTIVGQLPRAGHPVLSRSTIELTVAQAVR